MKKTEYLNAEDVRTITRDLVAKMNRISAAGLPVGGVAALARKIKISNSFLSQFLEGTSAPPPRLLADLGLEKTTLYVRKQKASSDE